MKENHKNELDNILLVSHSDKLGGAARACFRLNKAILKNNRNAVTFVQVKESNESFILGPTNFFDIFWAKMRSKFGQLFIRLFIRDKSKVLNSLNIFPSKMLKRINKSNANVVNLHWINGETISIKQISKINKPIIMTLHDMWAFCGYKHIVSDKEFQASYSINTKIKKSSFDGFIWHRKKKFWNDTITIVTPSNWLANCAKKSAIFHDCDIHVIPNPIDINLFKPVNKSVARSILNLPLDKKLIGFGSWKGNEDPNKGYDLLSSTLDNIYHTDSMNNTNIECVIFGSATDNNEIKFKTYNLGHLNDEYSLVLLYNALDLMLVPSRIENLPQVATESLSCGCPVVGFNNAGMADAVKHMITGYLAIPFDTDDLACGIKLILNDNVLRNDMSKSAREAALLYWNEDVIAKKYIDLFENMIKNDKK